MAVKAKLKNSLENLKGELKEKQEKWTKEWEEAKCELKARQKLFSREVKAKQEEFMIECAEVETRSR